jgi:signal transduction histidine kinase
MALAAGLVAGIGAFEGFTGSLIRHWTVPLVILGCGLALVMRSRWPIPAAVLCSGAVLAPVVFGQSFVLAGPIDILLIVPFLLAYTLGATSRLLAGLIAVALLAASTQAGSGAFNPIFLVITFGPWLAGRIIRSRHQLTQQLTARNQDLEAERERFSAESVRYERARIARELHDVVGHCVSVMVVQASAGQRLATSDPASVREVFDSIAEAITEAKIDVGRLVDLLIAEPGDQGLPDQDLPDLALVDELVRRAGRAGLDVTCRWIGDCQPLTAANANAAYRVVQESLTNALRHAPGAPVHITLRETGGRLEVKVVNDAPRQRTSGLEQSGTGRGLTGMRERIAACGGTVTATSTETGGWSVAALLPVGGAETTVRSA